MRSETKKINPARVESITRNGLTWTDISFPTVKETDALAEKYNFHPLSLEDSLSRSPLSKLDDHGTYLLLILHFPVMVSSDQVIKSTWFRAFIGSNYVITLHDEFTALTGLFQECQTNEETRSAFLDDGSGYLIYKIVDYLTEYCVPILDKILTRMDEIEDAVFDESSNDTQAIATLRRDIITLRRVIWPSRSVVSELKPKIKPFTNKDLDVYLDNLLDQIIRIWDNLEESKEVIEVFKDSDFVLVTNRINRIVQTLAIISSILLPFLVVSSFYGMNINLPGGLEHGNLMSFGILLGIMLVISGTMLYFFHRRGWI